MNYYHILGVRTMQDKDLVHKLVLDFVIQYTDDEVKESNWCKFITQDKLFKTTPQEAVEAAGLDELCHQLYAAKLRAQVNNMTVHKFITKEPIPEEDLDAFVDACNISHSLRNKLVEARINF